MSESAANAGDDPTVTISAFRLLQLELDAQRAQLLQTRVSDLEAALQHEQARSESQALALMQIGRSSDDRAREMEAQHAAVVVAKDAVIQTLREATTELKAAHAAVVASLQAENAALKAQVTSKLSEIHSAVMAQQTLEIYPVRPADSRQFATWHTGPVPPPSTPSPPPPSPQAALLTSGSVSVQQMTFDRTWAAALARGPPLVRAKVLVDAATGTRVNVLGQFDSACPRTFRSAAPLHRGLPIPHSAVQQQQQQQPLPAYRVVVESYGHDRPHEGQMCVLGLIPSYVTNSVDQGVERLNPRVGTCIADYGGWCIHVNPVVERGLNPPIYTGWVVLPPAPSARNAGGDDYSAYATTDKLPPVPKGSAVEFAVDYARGTCRVAFYTPTQVAGGFFEAPHAKMELRFIATPMYGSPGRPVPTAADSRVALYPAVCAHSGGAVLRFV